MIRKGSSALSDFELLEVMVGSGSAHTDVSQIARQLLKAFRKGTETLNFESLTNLRGVSTAQATKSRRLRHMSLGSGKALGPEERHGLST